MTKIALIPARGRSKHLPRKNIMNFLGKPIIAYTIEAAIETQLFNRVIVSTEDDEIASIAQDFNAEVDRRPEVLSTDQSTVVDVCLDYLSRKSGQLCDVDTLAVLYATAPMRNANDIKAVINLLSDDCDFALAVTPYYWPVHQVLKFNDSKVEPLFPDLVNFKSNEIESCCVDNGSTYAVHIEAFLQQKTFYGNNLKAYMMPTARSVDIDTPEDYDLALFRAKKLFHVEKMMA